MNFDQAFTALLAFEGDYSDHPQDGGGKTRYGITEAEARIAGYQGEMRDFPIELAKRIYLASYWMAVRADELPAKIRYAMFDAAVNSGPTRAIRWLQKAVGAAVDGRLGLQTLALANAAAPDLTLRRILGYRLQFMTEAKGWPAFSRGWSRRVAELLASS